MDELLFPFGPQFLCVSGSKGEGGWPGKSLGLFACRFNSWQGKGCKQQAVFLCSIAWHLAALSSGSGSLCMGLIQPETELL